MEVLRKPPHPLAVVLEVPLANHNYTVIVDEVSSPVVSDANSVIEYEIPSELSKYDAEYVLTVKDGTEVIVEDSLRIARPYLDVAKVYPSKDPEEYAEYERLARLIIDGIVGGFYLKKFTFERVGTGSDVLPLGYPVKKILQIKENGEVVFDKEVNEYDYVISDNGLYLRSSSLEDILEGSPIKVPTGSSDTYGNPAWGIQFGSDYVYTVTAEVGYLSVPTDIQTITKRIIDALACGDPNYAQKYIVKYETDEFRVDFDRRGFWGTGDLVVDQTLKKYFGKTIFYNIGVL